MWILLALILATWVASAAVLYFSSDDVLEEQARLGNVLRGMKKQHVLQVARPGAELPWLPVRVDRVREKHPSGTIMWEQWVMPDGMKIYFYNTIVIDKG